MSNFLIYTILGIVQGFTEPLPISSSGHLAIFEQLLHVSNLTIAYAAFINFGSTLAIVYYFRTDVWDLLTGFFGYLFGKRQKYSDQWDFILKIIVATIPLVIFGIIISLLGISPGENVTNVGFALLITGILLLVVYRKDGKLTIKELSYIDVLIIGLFQAIALMPGLSRSGMTLVAALLIGLNKRDAFRFSFIMFIPASLGALLFAAKDIISDPSTNQNILLYMLSFILAGFFTYIGLILTKKIVVSQKLVYFSIYCFIVGSLVILFLGPNSLL